MCPIGEAGLDAFRTEEAEPKETWETLITQYDWDVRVARAVLLAESEGNSNAFNPEWHATCQGSIGLFQIACLHESDPQVLFDPEYNVRRAYEIWSRQGWQPWGAYTDNRYFQYLE